MEWVRALVVCGGFLLFLEVAETLLGRTLALMLAFMILATAAAVLFASRP